MLPAFWKTCRKESGNSIKHLPMNNEIISLHSHPEWRIPAARWFQEKWGIPPEEYLTSIDESIRGTAAVPQWYIAVDGGRIIAGAGVIANDFHDRKDLTPNVCALYVEPELRMSAPCTSSRNCAVAALPDNSWHISARIWRRKASARSTSSRNTPRSMNATAGNTFAWCSATTGNRCGCIYHSTSVLRGARIKDGEGAEGEASRLYLTDNRMEKELNY